MGLSLLALDGAAAAADLPLKAPAFKAVYDWTGFYLGGHFGYGGGSFGPGTNPLPEQGVVFPHSITGLIGGFQAGYNSSFRTVSCSASKPMPRSPARWTARR